jgi:outer membrane protein assembly factor BamD
MSRRISLIVFLGLLLALTAACTNKKSVNPLAKIESKQPDKVLFDRAMDAMRHNRFDVARLTLQTLINTYPDSEYIARAKLAVGDSWYAEGGTASLAQAEQEYRDFQTFFPNMPEAAEAQLKIANIQYQQMEKPDRDYTHAKRAEEEYRNLIMQYPDNAKLVAEGKRRLLEVQEVLAEREFDIGRFYYLRQSYPASIARLESLVEKYPLYSRVDEALYLLGQNYEGQIARIRNTPDCDAHGKPPGCTTEKAKSAALEVYSPALIKEAAKAYDQILTRYPLMDRADDAKKRLAALHQPIPRPTKAAVAQNRAEEDSRREPTGAAMLMGVLKKGPNVSEAARVGEPSLVDPTPVSAKDVEAGTLRAAMAGAGEKTVGVEVVKGGTPPPNEAPPRSDTTLPAGGAPLTTAGNATANANELTPNVPASANELTPNADTGDQALPPAPPQINEIQQGQPQPASASASSSSLASDQEISTSKKKKKKGLKKIIPF